MGLPHPRPDDTCHWASCRMVPEGACADTYTSHGGMVCSVGRSRSQDTDGCRPLFKSLTFVLIFFAGAIGTFPLFVTPFFLPQYTKSLGFAPNVGAGLTAGFSLSSAVGRVLCGMSCDRFGALNTLAASQLLTGLSMLAMWPASTTMGPLVAFVIVNGVSNGG